MTPQIIDASRQRWIAEIWEVIVKVLQKRDSSAEYKSLNMHYQGEEVWRLKTKLAVPQYLPRLVNSNTGLLVIIHFLSLPWLDQQLLEVKDGPCLSLCLAPNRGSVIFTEGQRLLFLLCHGETESQKLRMNLFMTKHQVLGDVNI